MPRRARLVVPDLPHHVTQRGFGRRDIFFADEDRRRYIAILRDALARHDVRCLAWCLMSNHVHLVLAPRTADGLRAALARANTRYRIHLHDAHGPSGPVFQGRFGSVPMSDAHWVAAVRYVELNPVRAGLCRRAEDWHWSSARAHVAGKSDGLTDVRALGAHVRNWRAFLAEGAEAADQPA